MAGDRIRGILPALQKGKKDSGPAADVTQYCRSILVNAEDSDGQVEGAIEVFTLQSGSLIRGALVRRTIGGPCHVRSPTFKKLLTPDGSIQLKKLWPCTVRVPFSQTCPMHWRLDYPKLTPSQFH